MNLRKRFTKQEEVIGFEASLIQVNGLRTFTKYRIGVSAFTLVGEGPLNKDYIVITAGDGKILQ